LDFNVIIVVDSFDIPLEYLKKIEEFIEKEFISRVCFMKRGRAFLRLYLQMVYWILASSITMVNKCIKTYLKWDKTK